MQFLERVGDVAAILGAPVGWQWVLQRSAIATFAHPSHKPISLTI